MSGFSFSSRDICILLVFFQFCVYSDYSEFWSESSYRLFIVTRDGFWVDVMQQNHLRTNQMTPWWYYEMDWSKKNPKMCQKPLHILVCIIMKTFKIRIILMFKLNIVLFLYCHVWFRHDNQTSGDFTAPPCAQSVFSKAIPLWQWGVCSPGPQVWPPEGLCGRVGWERLW